MRVLKRVFIVILALIVLALIALSCNEYINRRVFVTEYTHSSPDLPEGFDGCRIFVISDLHEADFSQEIISHMKKAKPDLVVMLGDMVQLPDHSIDRTLEIVRAAVEMQLPVYAVSGNHDRQCGDYDRIIDTLWAEGVYMLENAGVEFSRGGDSIFLAGIKHSTHDNLTEYKIRVTRDNIKNELSDPDLFSVLLAHRADLYPHIKDLGVDLILGGHLHGGVARLPFVGGIIGQDNELFPKYEYGVVEESGSSTMIVSGGCDQNPKKKRYFNPPEVLIVTLKGE